MLLDADDCQLVLVDYQTRLMPAIFEHQRVLANASRLAEMAHIMQVPVWGTAQLPEKLGSNDAAVQSAIDAAGGKTLAKTHFSAMADGLGQWLRPPLRKPQPGDQIRGNARSLPKHMQKPQNQPQEPEEGRNVIVIAGCEAHVCLLQTALDMLEEEFEVWVVTDACSSRLESNRDAAFDRLAGNGAELVTTEMVAFEWLRTADHPAFKDMLALIK
jgi:nicotinamidase-related amidase